MIPICMRKQPTLLRIYHTRSLRQSSRQIRTQPRCTGQLSIENCDKRNDSQLVQVRKCSSNMTQIWTPYVRNFHRGTKVAQMWCFRHNAGRLDEFPLPDIPLLCDNYSRVFQYRMVCIGIPGLLSSDMLAYSTIGAAQRVFVNAHFKIARRFSNISDTAFANNRIYRILGFGDVKIVLE